LPFTNSRDWYLDGASHVSILAFSLSSLRSLRLNMLSAFDFSGSWMFDVERSMFVFPVDPFDFSFQLFSVSAFEFGWMLDVRCCLLAVKAPSAPHD